MPITQTILGSGNRAFAREALGHLATGAALDALAVVGGTKRALPRAERAMGEILAGNHAMGQLRRGIVNGAKLEGYLALGKAHVLGAAAAESIKASMRNNIASALISINSHLL